MTQVDTKLLLTKGKQRKVWKKKRKVTYAGGCAHGWKQERAVIQFKMRDRYVRFVLPLPMLGDFTTTATGRHRKAGTGAVTHAFEQACRQRWRALALSIKAKLESVESGIEEFESAFMAQVVMPSSKKFSLFCQFFLESY